MKKSIGLLYLCTGPYSAFWEDYYRSFEQNFLQDFEKHYFVFTDKVDQIEHYDKNKVTIIRIDALPWPLITLLRFNYFVSIENELKKYDYLMFSNANMICAEKVDEIELLPRDSKNETMFFVNHPGHFKEPCYNRPYERRKKSLAYIPYNCGKKYVIGALFGGKREAFLKMSHTLKTRIENDLHNNIIADWHDESHINRYIIGHDEFRILSPAYCYPVGFDLPVERKISGVSKKEKFDVEKYKGTEVKDKGLHLLIKKIIKRIKKEGALLFVRDIILFKKMNIIE